MKETNMNPMNLLLDKDILIISKPLAQALDLQKSIILRRIAYWCDVNAQQGKEKLDTHFHQGKWWMYNTLPEWEDDIAIFKRRTIQQALLELEAMNLILVGNFNKMPMDRTKWYTVNDEAYVGFIQLWQEHGCPVKDSDDYARFMESWNAQKSKYSTVENLGHDVPDARCNVQSDASCNVHSPALPIPLTNTVTTTDSIASAETTADAVGNRYKRRPAIVGTTEDSQSPTREDETTLPAYIQLMLMVTNSKWAKVSDSMRSIITSPMKAWNDDKKVYDFIGSAPDVYAQDRVFAAWLQEVVVPEMKQHTNNRVGRTKFLNDTRNYIRFQKWLKSEYGQNFAKRVKLDIAAPAQVDQPQVSGEDHGNYIR